MDKIHGIIIKVIHYNQDNGFSVIKLKLDFRDHNIAQFKAKLFQESVNVVCVFDRKPLVDEEYEFEGEFEYTNYGMQFKASKFSRFNENEANGIITYLSSEFFPGIGTVIATRVFDALGEECLNIIVNDKNALDNIKGISSQQKETIYNNLIENNKTHKEIVSLLELGISMSLSLKLLKQYGENACEVVKENPYNLISEVEGIGFIKADQIALGMGIDERSELRLKEYIMFVILRTTYQSGNSYITYDYLYYLVSEYLNKEKEIINYEVFDKMINNLGTSGRIHIDSEKNIFEINVYKSETYLAFEIKKILTFKTNKHFNKKEIARCLEAVKKYNNIKYNEKQVEAITKALEEPIVIITGGPGTGKSTIIKAITDSYSEIYGSEYALDKVVLLAPTGRAAKRLIEVTCHPASTIHKFLGFEGHGKYRYGFGEIIESNVVIIDEFSMVDVLLAARLFSALRPGTKVIIVGDSDQLPSVGPGNVLEDLINSQEITTIRLIQIHRQASGSSIISLANDINNSLIPETILEKQEDRNFLSMPSTSIISGIIKTIESGISKGMNLIDDIQVLIPLYKGEVGINAVNIALQERFNPLKPGEVEFKNLGRKFRLMDKVLQLVNRSEKKVMNGDIGYISDLEFDEQEFLSLEVQYDFGLVRYKKTELEDLTHAYAMSIHKAQGSEFPLVIMPFSQRYTMMLRRKLIYTGITRAKKYLIMLGNIEALQKGITMIEEPRKTKLKEKIKNSFESNAIDDSLSAFEDISENMEKLSPYDFLD